MINKKYKYGYAVVIIICIILMALGAKFDYALTEKLYNPKNTFGIFFEAFAYLPIYFFIPVFGTCLMIRNQNKASVFLLGATVLILSWGAFAYIGAKHLLDRAFIDKINPYTCGMAAGALAAVMFIIFRKYKKSSIRKIQALCAFALMYLISETAVIFIIKKICGRDRYEDIISGGSFKFTSWLKPEFFSDGSSFPSGHTAAAMGILVLLLLPFLFRFFKNKGLPLFILSYVYVGLMAFSRLIMGRHFLSDTAAAVLIMTVIFMALCPVFEKLYRKELLKD